MNTEHKSDPDFCSLDGKPNMPIFMLTLLRLGQILLKDTNSVIQVPDSKVCKLLVKHRNEIHNVYRPKELRELLDTYQPDFRGGGVKVEWTEITDGGPRTPRRYYLDFERIFKDGGQIESVSTQAGST